MITPTQLRETRFAGLACASFVIVGGICWLVSLSALAGIVYHWFKQ